MDETLDSYYLFGLAALQERLPALANEIDGVRAAVDVEYVHRMRVASRRLRNALALFGDDLPRKHYSAWRGEMRRVTRALGAARDIDVQITLVQEFLKQDTDEAQRVGIERLLLRLRQQRSRLQGKVIRALDRLGDKRILDLGRFNFGWHDYMIGVIGHLVLLVVGYSASLLFGRSVADEALSGKTLWHWLRTRREGHAAAAPHI